MIVCWKMLDYIIITLSFPFVKFHPPIEFLLQQQQQPQASRIQAHEYTIGHGAWGLEALIDLID